MGKETIFLGIDAGGTHTDAVLCVGRRIAGRAKTITEHDNLPASISEVLRKIMRDTSPSLIKGISRITLGTTLIVNAAVQGRLDPVGLFLSAGPGLSPLRFALGEHVCVVPGGLDHRGVEVSRLEVNAMRGQAAQWYQNGVRAFACVGKFSPRNQAHELAMAQELVGFADSTLTLGHRISGELNFPRRIASAYYNAAAARLHNSFLDAVEQVLSRAGVQAPVFLLKADGGSVPIAVSRELPVQSILSGPAASVMGVMALGDGLEKGCALLLDIGGTTTDIAFFIDGSPVMDRGGMTLGGRRTLVRALSTLSIGVGGDSRLTIKGAGLDAQVSVGPQRDGPAMAFGGTFPTLLDALNVLNSDGMDTQAGDLKKSQIGIQTVAQAHDLSSHECAARAWKNAVCKIALAVAQLLDEINAHPIYTLRELKGHRDVQAERVYLVGGPALCLRHRLESSMHLPVQPTVDADVANAIGAALTRPTATLQAYADTGKKILTVPALDFSEVLGHSATLDSVKKRALEILSGHLAAQGILNAKVEVTEADLFATLADTGSGSRDIRVSCQAVPGILGSVTHD